MPFVLFNQSHFTAARSQFHPCLSYNITLLDCPDIGGTAVLTVVTIITNHKIFVLLQHDLALQQARLDNSVVKILLYRLVIDI